MSPQLSLQTGVRVQVGAQGLLSRRGFLRCSAGAAAGLSFIDCLGAHAGELRKEGKACILLRRGMAAPHP